MKFTALLISAVSALAVHAGTLDVWVPRLTFPTKGADLISGYTYNFTWDASSPPPQLTNAIAVIRLRQNRTLPIILAGNTPLKQGYASVMIPWVDSGNYQAVLFGDSGNFSPEFHITSPDPSTP